MWTKQLIASKPRLWRHYRKAIINEFEKREISGERNTYYATQAKKNKATGLLKFYQIADAIPLLEKSPSGHVTIEGKSYPVSLKGLRQTRRQPNISKLALAFDSGGPHLRRNFAPPLVSARLLGRPTHSLKCANINILLKNKDNIKSCRADKPPLIL